MDNVDPDVRRVSDAASALAEHFDSIVIVATRCQDGRTPLTMSYRGNEYACRGSVIQWLDNMDARTMTEATSDD